MVQQGKPLSEALAAQGVFPEMMINMFRAGEASGNMEQAAAKLADNYQKEHRMQSRIKSATLYPKILACVAVAAVLIIFLMVMPQLEPMFEGMALPVFTSFLMGASHFIQTRWYVLLIAVLAAVAAVRILLTVPMVRFAWDKFKLKVPYVGKQLRVIYTARFSRSQASLYSSGPVSYTHLAGRRRFGWRLFTPARPLGAGGCRCRAAAGKRGAGIRKNRPSCCQDGRTLFFRGRGTGRRRWPRWARPRRAPGRSPSRFGGRRPRGPQQWPTGRRCRS